jgi:DNA-binding Lrp family transcriptional regulator
MKSVSLDQLDRQIVHGLIIDGRAAFSRIATVTGVSEQTVARRYRRMHGDSIVRVVGLADSQRLGQSDWVIRLQCVPDAAAAVAEALARRPDTSWVKLMSGGTEIGCVVKPASGDGRQDLLLRQLPASRRIVALSAHSVLHVFRGGPQHWPGATDALTAEQAAALAPCPAESAARPGIAQGSGPSGSGPRGSGGVPRAGAVPGSTAPPRASTVLSPDDQVLMSELASDGRASYADLASATHWHESTVRRRVDELRAAGVLYLDVDVDETAFGIRTQATLWMSVTPARLAAVGTALAQHPEIPFVAATTGTSNLIATVLCQDDQGLYRYLTERIAALDGVTALEVVPTIRNVKRAATVLPAAAGAAA